MIRVAMESDTAVIEDILLDAVEWMQEKNLSNLWTRQNIKWKVLSQSYKISDFVLAFRDQKAVGCMALTKTDPVYWHDDGNGGFLYMMDTGFLCIVVIWRIAYMICKKARNCKNWY